MGNACCSAGYTIKDREATIDASREEVGLGGKYDKNLASITFKNLDNARIVRLNLYNNQLTSLPVEIGRLTGLTRLDLDNNRLTSLPAEIGKLTGLTWLWLQNNELTSLPLEIGRLTGLTYLNLSDNPLTTPPMEVCRKGIAAISAYFLEHPTESNSDSKSEAKTMQPVASEEAVNGGLPSYDVAVGSDSGAAHDEAGLPSYDEAVSSAKV